MLEVRTCVDERTPGQSGVVKLVTIYLQMTAGVVVLILLFAAQAVITLWNSCALGTRTLRRSMIPAGRNAFTRMSSWRQAAYLFYLGTAASWTSSQASLTYTPEPVFLRAEVRAPASSGSRTTLLEPLMTEACSEAPSLIQP
jgi:hypothetical protein